MRARVPAAAAALANGAFAHAMDYEDAHEVSRTHPNAATVAAALAVAQSLGNVSGKEFITAVALGCDVVCRLALAQPRNTERTRSFYPPAIVGTFGAAVAAGRLLKLDEAQMLDAFSLALCQNSVSNEILNSPASHLRAVRDGFCAQSGVQGALLAQRGVKGFEQPFEGKAAFFATYFDGAPRSDILLAELGKKFAGGEIAFKAWPSCRDTHIYIQAVLELLQERQIDVRQIKSIVATVAKRNLIVCEPAESKKAPRTAIDAKFSVYFTVATALVKKEVVLPSFWDEARRDPQVLALAAKVAYRIDEKAAQPVADGGGVVLEIVLNDGTAYRRSVQQLSGSVGNPMPVEVLVAKFVDCGLRAAKPASAAELQALAARILKLETLPDASTLVAML
jgi:2-methylcitrate dehydratase PrpD